MSSFLGRVFSFGKQSSEETNWKEKRDSIRVDIAESEPLTVHFLNPETKEKGETLVARVCNISMRGCRVVFEKPEQAKRVQPGQIFVAALNIEGFSVPLHVSVVRSIREGEMAVQYKPPFPKELSRLEKFLEPRCLGLSLREIDSSYLKDEDKEGVRWFNGLNDTSLFCWTGADKTSIVHQQLIFLKNVVEWRQGEPVKTGRIQADASEAEGRIGWVKSDLLEFDATPNAGTIKQARILVDAAEIDQAVKKVFLDKVS